MRLEPLPSGLLEPELQRMLSMQLEYEGWQEASLLYGQVHAALAQAEPRFRARALMDHARVLRQLEQEQGAAELEARAESLMGCPIERDASPKSSSEQLKESQAPKKGFFGKLFGN
jgi:hypothetical protein